MVDEEALVALLGERAGGRVGFTRGIDRVAPETALPAGALREAENVDLDRTGRPRRRPGFTLRYAGAGIHSLWSGGGETLFVEDGTLKRLGPDWSAETVVAGLDPRLAVSYAALAGTVWWSNGAQSGRLHATGEAGPWGVPSPNGQPTLTVRQGLGGLAAGRYQVAVTFLSAAGEESGTGRAEVIELAPGDGIALTRIPQGEAARVRVYRSPPNADALYHWRDLPMGTLSADIGGGPLGRRLETQLTEPLPAGQLVRSFNGRLWVASGAVLWHSLALRYGLHRPAEDFFPFPARVTVLEPVADGLFVVADRTYFLAGAAPGQMRLRAVAEATGVEGTGLAVPARHFALEGVAGEVAFWFGSRGAMLGLPGGAVQALTEGRVAVPPYAEGATLFRERHGIRQLVTTLQRRGDASAFAAVDAAVAEVVRNGTLLP